MVWDLDDTFWEGTLSEGEIKPINDNISLVKILTDRGVVNSICSKNDYSEVAIKLNELGVLDYFVFCSIDWTPKGQRLQSLINRMGLRPENTLFIDDNLSNLGETQHYCNNIMVSDPSIISSMSAYFSHLPETDNKHSRLMRYKVLEEKDKTRQQYADNESFLYSTNTQVEICKDCIDQIERIEELILRTNQLNFTKKRISKGELIQLVNDNSVQSAYVKVKDKFGDYGIVGFYALRGDELIHYLFSCRTIGQGVEQYVYSTLGCPKITVKEPVISELKKCPPIMD